MFRLERENYAIKLGYFETINEERVTRQFLC